MQMQDFIEFAQSKMAALQNEMSELEGVRQRLADFLCEDASAFKLEDCFKVFQSFCLRFKAAAQENQRRQKQEQLAEARRKQREQQMALKRRSLELPDSRSGADPIMYELLGDIRSGRLGSDDRLKRHSDPAMLEKCGDLDSFRNRRIRPQDGEVEDSLERVSFRRSGRRKRVELNGSDTQSRERSGSSPPPFPTIESQEPEVDSKQKLRSKINDWMLQNEKEQKRERDLQLKLLQEKKKRLSSGQFMNGDVSSVEKDILEETEESDPKQNCQSDFLKADHLMDENDNFKITKSASSRRSESFTQKIIGLIDATSKPFVKTRLYSSTRESGVAREELENRSKDDSLVGTEFGRQAPDASQKSESNFDRFAPTRKTQRRLKLREMRIEAENIKAVKKESPDQEALTPSSPDSSVRTERHFPIQKEIAVADSSINLSHGNGAMTPERKEPSANVTETVRECTASERYQTQEQSETKESCANQTDISREGTAFCRQKNTSLRSRQSRLARRINSLSTPVTSPDSACSSVSESDEHKNKSPDSKLQLQAADEKDRKQTDKKSVPDEMNHAKNKVNVSHKVTVSTETKSKVTVSKPKEGAQTASSSSKSRVPLQKAPTSIPGVAKTTRNVKIQQTAQVSKRVPPSVQTSIRQPRVSNLTKASKNGSPASSISSLCNVNTNVKLVKNGKPVSAERNNAKKITIQHNGSVQFTKNNIPTTKPATNLNSKAKTEKNVTNQRGFSSNNK